MRVSLSLIMVGSLSSEALAQTCPSPPTAACIQQVGHQLQNDLILWGAAAIGLAVVAAGVKWIMRLMQ